MTHTDLQVIEFLNEFKIARTSTLTQLFYHSQRAAQRRLHALTKSGAIKRIKAGEYLYFTKMPKQTLHALTLTDYISEVSKTHKIDAMHAEYKCGDVRADALLCVDGEPRFIEVQLSGPADTQKYTRLKISQEWRKHFKTFPIVDYVGGSSYVSAVRCTGC